MSLGNWVGLLAAAVLCLIPAVWLMLHAIDLRRSQRRSTGEGGGTGHVRGVSSHTGGQS